MLLLRNKILQFFQQLGIYKKGYTWKEAIIPDHFMIPVVESQLSLVLMWLWLAPVPLLLATKAVSPLTMQH
jgi:hypothetical protein